VTKVTLKSRPSKAHPHGFNPSPLRGPVFQTVLRDLRVAKRAIIESDGFDLMAPVSSASPESNSVNNEGWASFMVTEQETNDQVFADRIQPGR
jgi:hypothetical protein